MTEASLSDPLYTQLPRAPSTLVVKRKSAALYKGRLRTRGDVAPPAVTGFASSPTTHRPSVKIAIALSTSLQWGIRAMGISHAFLQSGNMRESDRIVSLHHQRSLFLGADISHQLALTSSHSRRRPADSSFSRHSTAWERCADDPVRHFIRPQSQSRIHSSPQRRLHVCKVWSATDNRGFLICHVCDILFTGAESDLAMAEQVLRTFRVGGTELSTLATPNIPTGFLIELSPNMSISSSQNQCASDLRKLDMAELLADNSTIDSKRKRKTLRQALAPLIWLHQTMSDIGYDITPLFPPTLRLLSRTLT